MGFEINVCMPFLFSERIMQEQRGTAVRPGAGNDNDKEMCNVKHNISYKCFRKGFYQKEERKRKKTQAKTIFTNKL